MAAAAGALELDKTRLKTKRSSGLMESAFFKSPKLRWKLCTEETARSYAGEWEAMAAVSRIARIPMMVEFRLTPDKTQRPGQKLAACRGLDNT